MKIIVFGAAGAVGSRVVAESVSRGHQVTAVVRRRGVGRFGVAVEVRERDVAAAGDLVGLIEGHDLVISTLRPRDGEEASLLPLTSAVVEAARASKVRYIVVGGASVLLVPDSPGHTVLTAPGFLPDEVVPIAVACQNSSTSGAPLRPWVVRHLSLCPPALLAPGERTGAYRVGDDSLVVDGAGQSRISMEDFAVAMVDEAELPRHQGRRFTVGY